MAIHTDRYTRLTNDLEKDLVRVGGGNPNKAMSRETLSQVLVKAIETIDTHKPELLDSLWTKMVAHLTPEERARLEKLAVMSARD